MTYILIALAVLATAAAGLLGWRLYRAVRALGMAEARGRALQRERAQRENLQTMLDSRNAEARRLRGRVKRLEADMEAMAQQASQMNLNLFHESSLRILREKEEGARRMKLDLMERQLDEASANLKQSREEIRRLTEENAELRAEIDRLTAPQPRRAVRKREGLPNQVTLEDIISC